MWGSCRGRLTPHYSEVILCSRHKEEATLDHVDTCQHLQALPDVRGYKHLIEGRRYNDWSAQEQLQASLAFAALHIKVQQLLDLGVLKKTLRKLDRRSKSSDRGTSETSGRTTTTTDTVGRTPSPLRKTVRFAMDADSPMTETEQSPIESIKESPNRLKI
jgi:hypothetical protein